MGTASLIPNNVLKPADNKAIYVKDMFLLKGFSIAHTSFGDSEAYHFEIRSYKCGPACNIPVYCRFYITSLKNRE